MSLIITLNGNGDFYTSADVQKVENGTVIINKKVNMRELFEKLIKADSQDKKTIRIGKLPNNFYDGTIYRDEYENIYADILIRLPKDKHYFKFEKTEFNELCYPSLLFFFRIEGSKIVESKLYAVKGKDEQLYVYPYGNVNSNSGRICWGNISLPEISSLDKLDVVISKFLCSTTNNDYYEPGSSTKYKYNNLRQLVNQIGKYDEFPDRVLVKRKGTIDKLINRKFKS